MATARRARQQAAIRELPPSSTLTFRDHERYSLLARELQLAVNARAQQDQQQAPP